jgi:bilirubin oxidase
MKFKVVAPTNKTDPSLAPDQLNLPGFARLGTESKVRKLSLNEFASAFPSPTDPTQPLADPIGAFLGTLMDDNNPMAMMWSDPISEIVMDNTTEVWEIYNFTADAHPIHLHQVQFEIVNRQPLVTDSEGISAPPARLNGDPVPPESWETGTKDTLVVYPGMVTRLKARFDLKGLYLWHCHIIDHEDNEMMRPVLVQ